MISEQQRARDEAEKKVHALSRRMDHLERARREEEAPLLEAAFQKKVRATVSPALITATCPEAAQQCKHAADFAFYSTHDCVSQQPGWAQQCMIMGRAATEHS